jgi:hypothetical protein
MGSNPSQNGRCANANGGIFPAKFGLASYFGDIEPREAQLGKMAVLRFSRI